MLLGESSPFEMLVLSLQATGTAIPAFAKPHHPTSTHHKSIEALQMSCKDGKGIAQSGQLVAVTQIRIVDSQLDYGSTDAKVIL